MTEQERPPTEEELRAAYEAELKRIRVDDVLVQTVVSLVNLGGVRAGLVPGSEGEADVAQLGQAIDAIRALLPLVEPALGPDAAAIRDAVARLQLEYARRAGEPGAAPPEAAAAPPGPGAAPPEPGSQPPPAGEPEGEGPAQRSGRLWVPGR
jgi:hypothetical protein